mgnify:CR=1 FL=1
MNLLSQDPKSSIRIPGFCRTTQVDTAWAGSATGTAALRLLGNGSLLSLRDASNITQLGLRTRAQACLHCLDPSKIAILLVA